MNRLDAKKRTQVVAALVEGNSVRATVRMTGVAKNTIQKLVLELGAACADYMDKTVRNLSTSRLECDEIWSFIAAKEKTIKKNPKILTTNPDAGDTWTWIAMDADSKLVISFYIGSRTANVCRAFMDDVASRIAGRVQISTDGLHQYREAIESAFGGRADYGQVVKIFQTGRGNGRYSPPECIGIKKEMVSGNPDAATISTSYVERQNLTIRMSNRRFTRLTNAFSKRVENHAAALSLHYMNYNFCRVHQTTRVTPAMEAGLTDHVWTLGEVIALMPD
jgi:IS1 family transposase